MASVSHTVDIIFGAINNTGAGLNSVADSMDALSGAVSGVTAPMSDLADKAIAAELAIVAMGAALIAVSVNEAVKFQSAQNEIGTLLGANVSQANEFGKAILEYGKNSTASLESVTAATYSAISAGAAQADALEFVSKAEKLAIAGKAELNSTTVALVSTMNAYGASSVEAGRYSDVLFTTVRLGQTTLEELSASLSQVTLLAASGGVPIETLGAAIAALTAKGAPTAEAITAIRAAIQAMLAPTESAQKAAAALGLEFGATALKTKGFEGVLDDVMRATGGSEAQLMALFGSIEGVKAVLGLAAGDGEKFKLALEGMQSSAGATQAAFDLMSTNGALAFQSLANNLQIALIKIGTPILEDFGGSISGLSKVFAAVGDSVDAGTFEPFYKALEGIAKELEAFLTGVAKALPEALAGVDFSEVIASFGSISGAISSIFAGLDLTKPEDLRKALQFVVDSVNSLNLVVAGIVTAWRPAIETVLSAIKEFNALSDSAKIGTGEALGFAQVFEKFVKPIMDAVSGAIGGVGDALTLLAGVLSGQVVVNAVALVGGLTGVVGALGKAGLVGAAGAAGYAIGSELNPYIDKLVSKLSGSETTLGSWIYDVINGTDEVEKLGVAASGAADGVAELDKAAGGSTGGVATLAKETAKTVDALDGIEGAVSKVARGAFVDYKDALGNVIVTMTESGLSLESWNDSLLRTGGVVEDAAGKLSDLDKGAGGLDANIGKAATAFDSLDKAVRALVIDGPSGGSIVRFYDEMGRVSERSFESREAAEKFAASLKGSGIALDDAAGAAGKLAFETAASGDALKKATPIFDAATGKIIGYEQNLGYVDTTSKKVAKSQDEVAEAVKKAQEEAKKAEEATRAWNLEMAKLSSAKEIALIASKTAIATEQIKADAATMVAAFESVSESIASTNALIADLYGSTSETDRFGFLKDSLIRSAEERAKELNAAQIKLLTEQADNLRARTEALARGDSIIKIEGDGLAPHLEAFMWEILKAIQLRVNSDGLEMLLGVE